MHALVLAALATSVGAAQAMHKCTAADGAVSFQDAPCAPGAKGEPLKPRVNVTTMRIRSGGLGVPQLPPLDFSGPPEQRYARVHAVFEAMDTDGRECVIDLKVYGSREESMRSCGRFVAQQQQWRPPAQEAIEALLADRNWATQNVRRLDNTARLMERVNQHAATATLRMQSLSAR